MRAGKLGAVFAAAAMFGGCSVELAPRFEGDTGTVIVRDAVPTKRGNLGPPKSIAGGTLIGLANGLDVVAVDPDTDMFWKVRVNSSLGTGMVGAELRIGDEPGRLVEDSKQRVHVVLRGAGAVATVDVSGEPDIVDRRQVCREPRGIAFDPATDLLHVACAEGVVVSLPAAGGPISATMRLDDDLRDIVVVPGGFVISRFRAAELLVVDVSGNVVSRTKQADSVETGFGFDAGSMVPSQRSFSAGVAWRTVMTPAGVMMSFQRQQTSVIPISQPFTTDSGFPGMPGGESPYGGGGGCLSGGVVMSQLMMPSRTAPMPVLGALPVDLAADSTQLALVTSGDNSLTVMPLQAPPPPPNGADNCFDQVFQRKQQLPGQPVAVTFVGGQAVVQLRAPSGITVLSESMRRFPVQAEEDVGHTLFHAETPAGLACASCHPEGHEDGHVWSFDRDGLRRTQTLAGGLLATAPFHWDGTLPNIDSLMSEVFVNRMGHPLPSPEERQKLAQWLNTIPASPSRGGDAEAVLRGKEVFERPATECASCHQGAHFTNNTSADVGTGAKFQVPSLNGLAARAPYMHDGCAKTLEQRFDGSCGGGELHGKTAHLSAAELADLIAYLKTL